MCSTHDQTKAIEYLARFSPVVKPEEKECRIPGKQNSARLSETTTHVRSALFELSDGLDSNESSSCTLHLGRLPRGGRLRKFLARSRAQLIQLALKLIDGRVLLVVQLVLLEKRLHLQLVLAIAFGFVNKFK